jgi:3-methyladenine DNA glycosylase AlkD
MTSHDAFEAEPAAARVVAALRPQASAERAVAEKAYLKSDLAFLGVGVPAVRAAVTDAARSYGALGRDAVLAWARALWREAVHERRTAAIEILRRYVAVLEPGDLPQLEAWIRESRSWAYVDPLAGDVAGAIVLRHAPAWTLIDGWATDPDFWIRRSALLTLLPGIRRGQPDHDRFERYARPMLAEKEFFVRKAIGWVLRETAKKDPAYVAAWTRAHLDQMSGVTFREAIRRLPEPDATSLAGAWSGRSKSKAERAGLPAQAAPDRHRASAAPMGVHGGPCTKGQISSAIHRQSAVADSSPRRAKSPRLIRCRMTYDRGICT